jgi:4-hydroxybenzoate polyprenyltransferase
MFAAALMGSGAHFINALPDLEADALTGVQGLPHRLGRTKALTVGVALLGGAAAIVARSGEEPMRPVSRVMSYASAASIAAVAACAAAGRHRQAWNFALGTAGLTVALYLSRSRWTRSVAG